MRSSDRLTRNEGLEAVLVQVLECEERGESHPLEYWLERHSLHTEALKSFFGDRAAFDEFLNRPSAGIGDHLRYFGDYELLGEIARGGMGIIYRARQTNLNREVALKMILGGQFSSPADRERFRNEAQAISQLDHPCIVPLYEIGEHLGHHYFTMKLIAGGSLADRLGNGPLEPLIAVRLIGEVAKAVHYAHQRGILHRDLKPANILLESPNEFTPLLADFGLWKPLDGGTGPTRTGAILGTPTYMAPEQSRAEKQLTTAVDVYSLGAILYELLAGQPPFRGASVIETLEWLQHREPASPRILNPKIDRDLETITLKCLAKKPGDRFGSAEALADDLDRWQRGTPILARPVNSVERLAKWARRKPTIAGLITALAASILVGMVGMAWLLQKTWQAEQQAGLRADAETRERERAQNAEKLAETQLERAEESLYFNRVSTAYRYWQDGNLVKADELLRISPEKYRNWEWHHLQKLMHPEEDSIPGYAFRLTIDQKRMFVNHYQVVALWDVKAWKELKRIRHTDKQFSHSPDGTRYARFSTHNIQTGTQRAIGVKVFDTDTDTLIWENANLPIVANDIRNVVFSPDNRLIAVCGTQLNCAQGGEAGSTTVVLDGDTGTTKYTLKQGGIHAAFSPDGKTLAAYEERMELDRSNRTPVAENALIEDGIISCSWHWPEGKNLHFGDRLIRRDSWINLLDPITGESKGKLTHPEGYGVAQELAWSPDGKTIYSLQRGVTDVYDVPSRKHKAKLFGHDDSATAIAFTSDPNIVITGGFDHRIKQWNVKEGKSIREWKGHQQSITSLALIDNGRTMLSASGDHTIRRWRYHQTPGMIDLPSSGEQRTVGAFHWSNGFSSDGSRTIALDQHIYALDIIQAAFGVEGNPMNYRISLLDTKTQRTLQSFKSAWQANAMTHQYMKMIFSADDRYAAACFRDQPVILDLKTGAEHFLPFRSGSTIAFSPDSQTLATVQHLEQQVYTPSQPVNGIPEYTAPPPEIVPQPETPPEAPKAFPLEFTEPPAYLPNFYSSSFVRLWDISTRKETAFVVLDQFSCEGIAYSPDGRSMVGWGRGPYLQTGNSFNSSIELRVIDLTTRKQVRVLKGSGLNHRDAAFSPDGKIVVAASWDGNVYVWDVTTGELIHTLRGHQGYIWSACFTPDGKRIISSGNDALLKVWDVVTGEEVISFIDEAGKFRIEFDKRNELVGHGDYVFRRWTTVGK